MKNTINKVLISIRKFFISLLQDERGQQSTKRIIAIIGTLFLCGALFYKNQGDINEALITAITTIVCVCVGATTLDKFASPFNPKTTSEEESL